MRAATAAVTTMLVATATLTACGGSGGHTPTDQAEVCNQAVIDADQYVDDIRTTLESADREYAPLSVDPQYALDLARVNADVRQWRLSLAQLEDKDISPELRQAMDTLVNRLKPVETATEADAPGKPPVPDSSMEVYRAQLDNRLCP